MISRSENFRTAYFFVVANYPSFRQLNSNRFATKKIRQKKNLQRI